MVGFDAVNFADAISTDGEFVGAVFVAVVPRLHYQ